MARPSKYSEERAQAVLAAVRAGGTATAAAEAAGVLRETLNRWLDSNPSFADAYARARADAELVATRVVMDAALSGEWRAAAWWLERRRREDWSERVLATLVPVDEIVKEFAEEQGLDPIELEAAVRDARRAIDKIQNRPLKGRQWTAST